MPKQLYADPVVIDTKAWAHWAVDNWQVLLLAWVALNAAGFLLLARHKLPKKREERVARRRVLDGVKAGDLQYSKDE